MAQFSQKHRLLKALFFLLLLQLAVHDLLRDEIDFLFIWWWVPMLDEKSRAKVASTDALELLKLVPVGERREAIRLILIAVLIYLLCHLNYL